MRAALLWLSLALVGPALADEPVEVSIVIEGNKFQPAEIKVPAGKKLKLVVDNRDPSAEEFESHELKREKIVAGNSKITVFVGPLEPGRYPFFGEFHMDTAQGALIAE
jgi:plastocyanin